jgi:SAM-dependent methyltransferase
MLFKVDRCKTFVSHQSTLETAILRLKGLFPFPGYIEQYSAGTRNIVSTITPYVRAGAKILDFGSGPMDKTGVLQLMGYRCSALDDLQDLWHGEGHNRAKILKFAEMMGIDFRLGSELAFQPNSFDLVMICDVLEHLHDSPRSLLNGLLNLTRPEGYLLILVPNAANIRKRIDLLRGKTNLPDYSAFYWCGTPFRGHVREYVRGDLTQLSEFLDLTIVELKSCHNMLRKLPAWSRVAFRAVTVLFPGWRDSWILLAQKPPNWRPRPAPISQAEVIA